MSAFSKHPKWLINKLHRIFKLSFSTTEFCFSESLCIGARGKGADSGKEKFYFLTALSAPKELFLFISDHFIRKKEPKKFHQTKRNICIKIAIHNRNWLEKCERCRCAWGCRKWVSYAISNSYNFEDWNNLILLLIFQICVHKIFLVLESTYFQTFWWVSMALLMS